MQPGSGASHITRILAHRARDPPKRSRSAPPRPSIALRHKAELRSRLQALTRRMHLKAPDELADQLVLLIDGAYIHGQLRGKTGPVQALPSACRALVYAASA